MAPPQRSRRIELAVGVGVCVAGAMLVYAMLLAEGVGVEDELQLAAPEAARPGETIALRAYLYHEPERAEGPIPTAGDVDVELRDGARRLAQTTLAPGAQSSLEGALAIPEDADGTLYLVARAHDGDQVLATVARALAVAADAPPAADVDREASPLSHFQLGALTADEVAPAVPVVIEPGMPAPEVVPPPHVETLDAWVVGGVCVPEVPCVVAIDVGSADVEPQLTECAGVELSPREERAITLPPTRYRMLAVVVHGPEGTCNLGAVSLSPGTRGRTVAHRTLRLPVALATPYLGLESPEIGAGERPRWAAVAPPGRDGVVLDVFRAGRWMRTVSVPAGNDPAGARSFADLPGEPLAPGVYLVEARADPLPATTYVAPRLVVVGGDAALRAEADPPARPGATGDELGYFLAAHEQHGLALPGATSGLADDRARLEGRKRTTRTIAFVGIAVGILLLVSMVMRRGLSADAEARAVMVAAGVPGADDTAARRKGTLTVVLMVLGLGLALATGAALIAAHQIAVEAAGDPSASR